MFDNDKVLNTLTDKVNDLLARYNEICEENESLRNELISVKAQNEAKTNQIARLEEDLRTKNTESDDVIRKIEAVLGTSANDEKNNGKNSFHILQHQSRGRLCPKF